jgi:ankyrin repeat protein
MAKFVIAHGADIYCKYADDDFDSGFHMACSAPRNWEMIEYLIDINFDVNLVNDNGKTGFDLITKNLSTDDLNQIIFLIEKGKLIENQFFANNAFVIEYGKTRLRRSIILKNLLFENFYAQRIAQVILDFFSISERKINNLQNFLNFAKTLYTEVY